MNIVIATIKSWNLEHARRFKAARPEDKVRVISARDELTAARLARFKPDWIFFPHWSWIIPPAVYQSYRCVVFHMTDLPYGRGGSPLQNLIVRGHKQTKISALRVVKDIDAGPVYLKQKLSLSGTADDILRRAADIIFGKMIPRIADGRLKAQEQRGKTVIFKRRRPEEGDIGLLEDPAGIFDYVRMLDAEGYPRAFLEHNKLWIEFADAQLKGDVVEARAYISVKKK